MLRVCVQGTLSKKSATNDVSQRDSITHPHSQPRDTHTAPPLIITSDILLINPPYPPFHINTRRQTRSPGPPSRKGA